MGECNSIKHDFHKRPNIFPNILNEQQLRRNKINEIKDYFLAEIRQRELISKNVSKYIASLDYFDKSLNVLSILLHHLQLLLGHLQEYLEQVVVLHFQLLQDL